MLSSLRAGKLMLLTALTLLAMVCDDSRLHAANQHDSFYRLQIARYRDEQQAVQLSQSMKNLGHISFYEKVMIEGKGDRYRVYLGRFKSRNEAQAAAQKMMHDRIIEHYMIREPDFAHILQSVAIGESGKKSKKEEKTLKSGGTIPPERKIEKAEPAKQEREAENAVPAASEAVPAAGKAETERRAASLPHNPLFEAGYNALQSGNQEEALSRFKKLLGQDGIGKELKEKTQRLTADCHFFLGEKGSKQDLLSAVDLYKAILVEYPDAREENALAEYRLAKSYEKLNFYYEARKEFDNVIAKYPESAYLPESIFMAGEMSYRIKRFNDAAERLKEYATRYPGGEHAKRAMFNVADCYSQLQQMDAAEHWYKEALKQWPDMESIPRRDILNLGFHYFRNKKYADAVEMFFLHANLFPEDENNKDVLYALARSLVEMQQYPAALKMFGLIIEQYPESRQAWESVVIMANLGIQQSAVKLPVFMTGAAYYRDPIGTYNFMLRKFPFGELTEGLLYQRGQALWKIGRYKESFYNYVYMVQQFPRGRYRAEGIGNLALNAERLIGDSYAGKDYLFVAEVYFKTYEKALIKSQDFKIRFAIGDSLKKIGFYDEALRVFGDLLKDTADHHQERSKVLVEVADCHHLQGDDDRAEKMLAEVRSSSNAETATIVRAKRLLADIYSGRGTYDKAASLYGDVLAARETLEDRAAIQRNYGVALVQTKTYSSAKVQFQNAIASYEQDAQRYAPDVPVTAYSGLGDCLFREGDYKDAILMYRRASTGLPDGADNLWAMHSMARSHARIENVPQAQQILSSLRDKGGEGFWTQLADYTMREESWISKYGKYVAQP